MYLKELKKKKVVQVKAFGTTVPFFFTTGFVFFACQKHKININEIGQNIDSNFKLFFESMQEGYSVLSEKPLFNSFDDFIKVLEQEDIEAISAAFEATMPANNGGNAEAEGNDKSQ